MDPMSLSAEQILKIDSKDPEKLFSKDSFRYQFMRLRKKWHPDTSTIDNAESVFKHLMDLAETAKGKIATDSWAGEASITFSTHDHKTFRFRYKTMREFEMGKMYIGDNTLMYVIDKDQEDLFDNGIKMIRQIKYPNNKLETEFKRLFPKVKLIDKKTSIGLVAVFEKPEGTVLLQDLIDYMPDNRIDPKHVAWITSSLYNIATFLDHVGICHNSILPTTVFVDPKNHAAFLLGGWWFAVKTGSKLKAIPRELLKVLPNKVFDEKVANTAYDRQAVKGVAIGCLGDPTLVGMSLLSRKDVPNPMLNWIRSPSGPDAVSEYGGWEKTLEKSFGKRKFIAFDVNINDIY